jgi:hypothetical protein
MLYIDDHKTPWFLNFSVEAKCSCKIGGIVPMQSGQTFFLFFEMFLLGGYSSSIMGQKKLSIKMVGLYLRALNPKP